MSDSESSDGEIQSKKGNRRRGETFGTPKNVPRKKPRESVMAVNNGQSKRKGRTARKVSTDNENDSFSDSSHSDGIESSSEDDCVENHPPKKNKSRKRQTGDKDMAQEEEEGRDNREDVVEDAMAENDDEAEKRMRQRRRLSRSFHGAENGLNGSLDVSASESNGQMKMDRNALRSVYATSVELFQQHKITQQNAFGLKLLECLEDIINGPDFDKDDLHMVGRTLEVSTRIYCCRVEHTHREVMHLASDITIQNKKSKERSTGEGMDDNEMEHEQDENEEQVAHRKPKNRKKRSQFVEEDDRKLCTDFEGQSTKCVTRRTTLKKKFSRMIDDDIDFDYISYFTQHGEPHPLDIDNNEDEYSKTASIPPNLVSEEMKTMTFMDFNILSNFDPATFDVWGVPLVENIINIEDCQDVDLPPENPDFAYNVETRPDEYNEEMAMDRADDDDHGMGISAHYANAENGEENSNEMGGNQIPLQNITSLDQLSQYFSAIKNIQQITKARYGWAGPQFFQPRRNWTRPNTDTNKRKVRKKKEPIAILFENINWKDPANKYTCSSKEKTVLDEKTIEKWSLTKTHVPYMGIETTEYGDGDGDDLADAFANIEKNDDSSSDFVHPLLRYFTDPKRNIASVLEKEIEKYGKVRDAKEFANERGEFNDDSYIPMDDDEMSARGDIHESFNHSNCAGGPLDAMGVPIESTDQLATLAGIFPSSMGLNFEDDFMTRATDATESIKFAKKPKPIDMHALKSSVLRMLRKNLLLNENGGPTQDEDTRVTVFELLAYIYKSADAKMREHLSVAIVMVALMHVVADSKLFMFNYGDLENPTIVCRGKLWQHKDHIPQELSSNEVNAAS